MDHGRGWPVRRALRRFPRHHLGHCHGSGLLGVLPKFPVGEHTAQFVWPQEMVWRSGTGAKRRLRCRERLVDHESTWTYRVAQRLPDCALQIIGADHHIEAPGRKRRGFKVGHPKPRVSQRAGAGLPDTVEIAVDTEDMEARGRCHTAVPAAPHGEIEQVAPCAEPRPDNRKPADHHRRRRLTHLCVLR